MKSELNISCYNSYTLHGLKVEFHIERLTNARSTEIYVGASDWKG
jgi:hypothetical protein